LTNQIRQGRGEFWKTGLEGALTPTWYVTFERKRGVLPKHRRPRETKTFATEAEAKAFTRLILEEGLAVFAGTINPHFPKRLILSSYIHSWLENEEKGDQCQGDHE
jgi:hypothetical protein